MLPILPSFMPPTRSSIGYSSYPVFPQLCLSLVDKHCSLLLATILCSLPPNWKLQSVTPWLPIVLLCQPLSLTLCATSVPYLNLTHPNSKLRSSLNCHPNCCLPCPVPFTLLILCSILTHLCCAATKLTLSWFGFLFSHVSSFHLCPHPMHWLAAAYALAMFTTDPTRCPTVDADPCPCHCTRDTARFQLPISTTPVPTASVPTASSNCTALLCLPPTR
jgi:hypothetical protein